MRKGNFFDFYGREARGFSIFRKRVYNLVLREKITDRKMVFPLFLFKEKGEHGRKKREKGGILGLFWPILDSVCSTSKNRKKRGEASLENWGIVEWSYLLFLGHFDRPSAGQNFHFYVFSVRKATFFFFWPKFANANFSQNQA